MKSTLTKLLAFLIVLGSLASCEVYVAPYQPAWYYNCYPVYDYWGWYMYDECYWEYYNQDGSMSKELDMVAEISDRNAVQLEKTAQKFAEKFNLSAEQGLKIAKNAQDFAALSDRSEADIADFAQKLYGVNPTEIVSALSNAQVGNNSELDAVIEKAATNFNTDKANMRSIINELHGKALIESGISF